MLIVGPRAQFVAGLASGIVGLSAAIEAAIKVSEHGSTKAFFATLEWIGTFEWLSEYQTLLTGLAAVYAASLSVKAVRDQIRSSEAASNEQLKQAERIEAARVDAKLSAARAVLPLALSTLTEYSDETSEKLVVVIEQCSHGVLPKTANVPLFMEFPQEVVSSIKEMIEYAPAEDRNYFWQTLLKVQVLRARLNGLIESHSKSYTIVTKSNIQALILDSVEIGVRSGSLFDFGRGAKDRPPEFVTKQQMQDRLRFVIFDEYEVDEIVKTYGLIGNGRWGERWLAR